MLDDVILVRHGEPACAPHMFLGSTNPPLDACGRTQIAEVRAALHEHSLYAGRQVYSSGLIRAQQSAAILTAAVDGTGDGTDTGTGTDIITDARLNEIHFGDWEGLLFADVERQYPDAVQQWFDNPLDNSAPAGESFRDLALRIDDFLTECADTGTASAPCIIVAHFCSIAVLASRIVGMPLAHADRLALARGQYGWIQQRQLRVWGVPQRPLAAANPERSA